MLREELIRYIELWGVQSSFVIKNFSTGETVSYQEDLVVPSASLIKVPVMMEAFRQLKSGTLSPEHRLQTKPEEIVPYSVLEFLDAGNTYSIFDLLRLMIIYSDNTAANLLIDLLGMDQINDCVHRLGLQETRLQRKMMDTESRKKGKDNLTTAREMAHLMIQLYDGKAIDSSCSRQMLQIMKGQSDECMMRADLPDEIPIARKSGELENLDHEMAIVYGEHCDYLYVFFVWNAQSNNVARQILQKTSRIVFDYFT